MKKIIIPVMLLMLIACNSGDNKSDNSSALSGVVKVDGSSTVFPVTEAVAEEFGKVHPKVRVTVGISGTGGGFKKYCVGEIDINDASRTIKGKEIKVAKENNVEYIELPVAYDGLSVVMNKNNDFIDYLTVEELNSIWKFGSKMKLWSDVRKGWPKEKLNFMAQVRILEHLIILKKQLLARKIILDQILLRVRMIMFWLQVYLDLSMH